MSMSTCAIFGIKYKLAVKPRPCLAQARQGKGLCMVRFVSFRRTSRGYVAVLLVKDSGLNGYRGFGRVFLFKERPSVFEVFKKAGLSR